MINPTHSTISTVRQRLRTDSGILMLVIGSNVLIWIVAFFVLRQYAFILGTAGLAYTLGLAHALDADHICAIDNVTRRLMQDGQRPTAVGCFFSLGHSTIVILLSLALALTAAGLQSHFPRLERMGGLLGTSVSAAFLILVALINMFILRTVYRTFVAVRKGEPYHELSLDEVLSDLGWIGRMCRPIVQFIDRSWKMYFVGFLFGLGFDTATQVGLLGISAAASTQRLPIWSIMVFPLLFTAGMCLVDTLDGILMVGAYGWAYIHPIRKLYYNMTITAISVLVAVVVGVLEILNVVGDEFNLHGFIWDLIGKLGDHFAAIGICIVCVFILSWISSIILFRWMRLHKLDTSTPPKSVSHLSVVSDFASPEPQI